MMAEEFDLLADPLGLLVAPWRGGSTGASGEGLS